jgi:hypothetical protein
MKNTNKNILSLDVEIEGEKEDGGEEEGEWVYLHCIVLGHALLPGKR